MYRQVHAEALLAVPAATYLPMRHRPSHTMSSTMYDTIMRAVIRLPVCACCQAPPSHARR